MSTDCRGRSKTCPEPAEKAFFFFFKLSYEHEEDNLDVSAGGVGSRELGS